MMKSNKHFVLPTLVLAGAYFLSACGGTLPQDNNSNESNFTPSPIASNTPVAPVASATVLPGGAELEIFGIVESMTETSITINGVTYKLVADLTQFNDVISVGDQVRILVIVNADGTFTIREVEISIGNDNSNGNTNVNSNDNSNVNSNDANNSNANDNNNANSNDSNNNDSNTNGDNGNDSNSNDNNSNDNNSNDNNSNDTGGNGNDNDSGGSGSGGNNNDDNGGNDDQGNDNG